MASRIQKVKIQAETSGFQKATKQTNQLSDAQERTTRSTQNLGKASAASGRQFSAQASGLGGFVAAYAGAAANIFAVQQAFSALSRAAQVETIVRGTRTLAANIGQSGDQIIAKLQQVTQGQLTVAEAAQNANIALSAGFNVEQIEQLTDVATRASKALGRNLTESLQRVFRGAIKLEPELLDEIGIFTRIDPAVAKYAASLNRSVGSLTDFERRQAFANAVAEEGTRKFSDIDISSRSAQKSLEQLSSKFIDLATQVGITLSNVIEPFVSFLARDFGNTLLVLGGILTLVFGRGAAQVADFTRIAATGLSNIVAKGEKAAMTFSGTGRAFAAAVGEVQETGGAFKGQGAFAGSRAVAQRATEAKSAIAVGDIKSVAQAATYRKALQDVIVEEEKFQKAVEDGTKKVKDKDVALERSRARVTATTASVNALSVAENRAGLASRFLGSSANVASVAIRGLGLAVSTVLASLNAIFLAVTAVQLVFQAFGVDAIGAVINWFKKLNAESAKVKEGLRGLSVAAEVSNILQLQSMGFKDAEDFANQAANSLQKYQNQVEAFNNLQGASAGGYGFIQPVAEVDIADNIRKDIEALKKLQSETDYATEEFNKYRREILILENNLELVTSGTLKYANVVATIATETGKSTSVIARSIIELEKQGSLFEQVGNIYFFAGEKVGEFDGELVNLNKTGILIARTISTATELASKQAEAFSKGALSAEKAAESSVGVRNQLDEVNKRLKELDSIGAIARLSPEFRQLQELAKQLNIILLETTDTLEKVQEGEKFLKTIQQAFSKEIKAVDNAIESGIVGIDGMIAKTSVERQANLLKIQKTAVDTFKELRANGIKSLDQAGEQTAAYKQGEAALKAQAGFLIKLPELIETENVALDKKLVKIEGQTELLELQNNLLTGQNKLLTINTQLANLKVEEQRVTVLENILELSKNAGNELVSQLNFEKQLLDLEKQKQSLAGKADLAALDYRQALESNKKELEVVKARQALARAQQKSSFAAELFVAEVAVLKAQMEERLNAIKDQEDVAKLEYKLKIEALESQEKILKKEIEINNQRNANAANEFSQRTQILEKTQAIELSRQQLTIDRIAQEKLNIESQRQIDLKRLEINRDSQLEELKIVQLRFKLLNDQVRFAKENFALSKRLIEEELKARGQDVTIDMPEGFLDTIDFKSIFEKLQSVEDGIVGNTNAEIDLINSRADAAIAAKDAEKTRETEILALIKARQIAERVLLKQESEANEKEIQQTNQILNEKLAMLAKEKGVEDQLFKTLLTNLNHARMLELLNSEEALKNLKEQYSVISTIATDLKSSIGNTLKGSIDEFYTSLAEGTLTMKGFREGVNDLFVNILQDISKSITEQFVTEPIVTAVGKFIDKGKESLLGSIATKSSDGSATKTQALMGGAAGDGLRGSSATKEIEAKGAEITSGISNIMDNVKGTTIAAFGGVLAATGNFKTAIIAAFVEIFLRIMAERAAKLVFAAGGEVGRYGALQRFAKGGPVNKLRDRVPALLEPGEFVIRKPAAKAIGGSALNQLNATGKMNSNPNVTVNVQNNGTPQEVQSSTVRNDMGQLVIDLVVKDIQNNGRVRKAMRG